MFLPAKAMMAVGGLMNVSQLRTPRALNQIEKGLRGFAFYFFPSLLRLRTCIQNEGKEPQPWGRAETNSNN